MTFDPNSRCHWKAKDPFFPTETCRHSFKTHIDSERHVDRVGNGTARRGGLLARELRDELRRVEAELEEARKPRPISDAAVEAALDVYPGGRRSHEIWNLELVQKMRVAIEAADRVRESDKNAD